MVQSRDGFTWTPSTGVRQGLPSIGVVLPSSNLKQGEADIFDAVVIGTGYAGLVATRDLTTQGNKDSAPRNLQVEKLTESGMQGRRR